MNKKLLSIFCVLFICETLLGQVQRGYVRTVNRPGTTVQRLQSVSLRFSGVTNGVLSGEKGAFQVILKGKKNGDFFSLLYARKTGFELLEQHPSYNFSDHQDIEIVMVDANLLVAEKRRIEERAYRVAEENFSKQLALVEEQRKALAISEEAYAERVKELEMNFEKYQSLIGTLADRYARTDYEGLSDLDRQINMCIENGDLMRADSLIRTDESFNPYTAVENKRAAEAEIAEKEANFAIEIARKKQQISKQAEHDAERFYQKFTIALANYQKDSAFYYICQRSELDTTNVTWMMEAANFVTEYMADYNLAKHYYDRAYGNILSQYGEEHEMAAYCLNDMAEVYVKKDLMKDALDMLNRSLKIRKKCFGEQSLQVAKCYGSLGILYKKIDNLKKAEDCFKKALKIYQSLDEVECGRIAIAHVDLGLLEHVKGNDKKAIEYYKQALPVLIDCKGKDNSAVIEIYHALGGAYHAVDSFALSEQCYEEAIAIERRIYGDNHPAVATSIDNLGVLYSTIGQDEKALKCQMEALNIRKNFFGEQSLSIGNSYNNICTSLYNLGKVDEALEYMKKALQIDKTFAGERSTKYAKGLGNLAVILSNKKQYDEALETAYKALDIYKEVYGEQHKEIAALMSIIANIYLDKNDFTSAIDWYHKAIEMSIVCLGEQHTSLATVYNNLGECYRVIKDYDKAIEMCLKSMDINRKAFGKNSRQDAITYGNLAVIYLQKKDYDAALEYTKQYDSLLNTYYGKDSKKLSYVYYMYYLVYKAQEDYEKALEAMAVNLEMERNNTSDTSNVVLGKLMETYLFFDNWIDKSHSSVSTKKFQQFMEDKLFVCIIHNGVAADRGLNGKYYLLEYNDWNIDNDYEVSFVSTSSAAQTSNKTITLMKDDNIVSHTFSEQKIGVEYRIEYIEQGQKQHIKDLYQTWKKHSKQ